MIGNIFTNFIIYLYQNNGMLHVCFLHSMLCCHGSDFDFACVVTSHHIQNALYDLVKRDVMHLFRFNII